MATKSKYPVFQATGAFAITEHETNNMTTQSSGKCDFAALFIGTAGDVVVDMVDGQTAVTFKNVANGTFLPILVTKVRTATTAADIVGLYTKQSIQ